MLGLGDQIGRDEIGVAGFVGERENLAGAKITVNTDSPGQEALGELDIRIARADDFIDAGNGGRAKSQSGDGGRAPGAEDVLEVEFMAGGQDEIRSAVFTG